jgi:hypothetical protein
LQVCFKNLKKENGDIYTWGSSEYGQLGLGDTESQLFPKKMETLEGIKVLHISCGETHTVAIVDSLENLDEEEEEEEEVVEEEEEEVDEGPVTRITDVDLVMSDKKPETAPVITSVAPSVVESLKDDVDEEEEEEEPSVQVEKKQETKKQDVNETPKVEYKNETTVDSENTTTPSTSEKTTLTKDMDPYKVCGYLNKKGDKGIVKSWKKRWFQINEDVIGYYEQEDGKIKGTIVIKDILDVLPGQVKYGFNIVSSKKRVYELHAFTQSEKDIWCNALKKIISKKK